ncbi:MAG TPA: hypothetical protein PKW98_16875, partial [Candidatus Wallbacteria bacterium]|nr:hypothetical protein [Candidatus Wallbacteria bacterium]
SAMFSYFAQLYGTENDILFQVQLFDDKNEESRKKFWHKPEDIAFIPIPFYKVNESEIYRIIGHIDDHKLKQSFISFYNRVSTPTCSKMLYGFNLYDHFADHGLNHSINILKILADLLEPKNENNVFLTSEEVYILACAIILHDIGMCGDAKINEVSRVRKYHGLISYNLLMNESENLIRNMITGNGKNGPLEKFMTEIALASKFHQKVGKLYGKPETKDQIELTTLEHDIKNVLGVEDPQRKHRLYKLASLLRVLDSADVQRDRVFDANVLKKQIEKNKKELAVLEKIIKHLATGINEIEIESSELITMLKTHPKELKDKINKVKKTIAGTDDGKDNEKVERINDLIDFIDKHNEVNIQEPQHYQKHMAVERVEIKNGTIELIPSSRQLTDEQQKIYPRLAQKEIKEEISRQFEVFIASGINFEEVKVRNVESYEEEKKFEVNGKDCFEGLKKHIQSDEFKNKLKQDLNIRIECKDFASTNIDNYYDNNERLLKKNVRLRIRNTGVKDYEECRICLKAPWKENKSVELEPLYYESKEPPETISYKVFKKYFGNKTKDFVDFEADFKKVCRVVTDRETQRLIIESLNDEDYLWSYEIEVS